MCQWGYLHGFSPPNWLAYPLKNRIHTSSGDNPRWVTNSYFEKQGKKIKSVERGWGGLGPTQPQCTSPTGCKQNIETPIAFRFTANLIVQILETSNPIAMATGGKASRVYEPSIKHGKGIVSNSCTHVAPLHVKVIKSWMRRIKHRPPKTMRPKQKWHARVWGFLTLQNQSHISVSFLKKSFFLVNAFFLLFRESASSS